MYCFFIIGSPQIVLDQIKCTVLRDLTFLQVLFYHWKLQIFFFKSSFDSFQVKSQPLVNIWEKKWHSGAITPKQELKIFFNFSGGVHHVMLISFIHSIFHLPLTGKFKRYKPKLQCDSKDNIQRNIESLYHKASS